MEKEFELNGLDPIVFYGPNEKKLDHLKKHFPKLRISARGNTVRAVGEMALLTVFEEKLQQLVEYQTKYNRLTTAVIDKVIAGEEKEESSEKGSDVLVYGNKGLVVKARSKNQKRIVAACQKDDMVFAIGPAGTGKTYTAVALAVRALKNKEVRRIIVTRPAVEAGEHLGFLPGDLKEKLDPYMQPIYDALRDMIPPERLADFIETGVIQIAPLAFMRGRTLDHAFVILDEAQNATTAQLKMFLTRMGSSAKFVITGDMTQIDLPRAQQSGLKKAVTLLDGVEGVSCIHLDRSDIIRHRLVEAVISAFEKEEKAEEKRLEKRKSENTK